MSAEPIIGIPMKPEQPDPFAIASDKARSLDHIPLRDGWSFECWKCPDSGTIRPDATLIGKIFTDRCEG